MAAGGVSPQPASAQPFSYATSSAPLGANAPYASTAPANGYGAPAGYNQNGYAQGNPYGQQPAAPASSYGSPAPYADYPGYRQPVQPDPNAGYRAPVYGEQPQPMPGNGRNFEPDDPFPTFRRRLRRTSTENIVPSLWTISSRKIPIINKRNAAAVFGPPSFVLLKSA